MQTGELEEWCRLCIRDCNNDQVPTSYDNWLAFSDYLQENSLYPNVVKTLRYCADRGKIPGTGHGITSYWFYLNNNVACPVSPHVIGHYHLRMDWKNLLQMDLAHSYHYTYDVDWLKLLDRVGPLLLG